MERPDLALVALCAASAVGWSLLGAWRQRGSRVRSALRGLLGGGAAFGIALSAYELLDAAGFVIRWETVLGGGWNALGLALAIGFVEEGAKLGGIALAVQDARRPGAVMGITVGVGAGFAALEAAIALAGLPPAVAASRALFAPVAHALLSAPLGFALAAIARREHDGRPAGSRSRAARLPWLVLALGASGLLHAACDLSLAVPTWGRLGYAAALLAPLLAAFLHARRFAPALATRRTVGDVGD